MKQIILLIVLAMEGMGGILGAFFLLLLPMDIL